MKIAIATEGANVSGHFGKCENFTIVEIQNSDVKSKTGKALGTVLIAFKTTSLSQLYLLLYYGLNFINFYSCK